MNIIREVDEGLFFLQRSLALLEPDFIEIINYVKSNPRDAKSDGVLEYGEFLAGMSFAVCQKYIAATLGGLNSADWKVEKKAALDIGPIFKSGITFVAAINAGANYWKHSDEWPLHFDSEENLADNQSPKTKPHANSTIETIGRLTETTEYICSNLLSDLIGHEDFKITALACVMVEWRMAVIDKFNTWPRENL